jgi:AhpD family alkylhydroperoxidase
MSQDVFTHHTLDSAPVEARRSMTATVKHLGYLPAPVARLASSPHLLDAFLRTSGLFESTTLDPVAREVLVMTIATRNGCHVCVAMHTGKLRALGANNEVIAGLRAGRPLTDERLEAIRVFTIAVLDEAGAVSEASMRAFLAQGYTSQNALEVVLGIGAYTMYTLANRMTRAPLDEQLEPFAWEAQGN